MIKIINDETLQLASDIFYNKLKASLSKYECPQYIKWLKDNDKTKIKDPHHIFGSYGSYKSSDLLIKMVSRSEHVIAEGNKSEYAIEHLAEVINSLQKFTIELLEENKRMKFDKNEC